MRKYETLLVARADLEDERMTKLMDEISALIKREGGEITGIDHWGVRRLEYPIDNEKTGHYSVINFQSGPGVVREIERVSGIRDDILRTKTLVIGRK